MQEKCEICEREELTTFHHLIPVTLHTKKWYKKNYDKLFLKSHGINLCKQCHKTVHKFWDEKTLGKDYNTLEKILKSEKIQKHINWIIKLKHDKK